jgi:hypothetical protein
MCSDWARKLTSVAQVTWRQFHSRVRLTVVIASAIERNIKLFGVVEQQFDTHLLNPSEILSRDHQGLQRDPGSNALLDEGVIEPWVTQPRQLETQPHLEDLAYGTTPELFACRLTDHVRRRFFHHDVVTAIAVA